MRHAAGRDVDLDDGGVAGVGEGAGRIVERGLGKPRRDRALEAVGLMIGGAGEVGDRDRAVGAGDLGEPGLEHDVVRRRLQNMPGDGEEFGLAACARRGATRRRK